MTPAVRCGDQEADRTRLIDEASGWYDQGHGTCGAYIIIFID
ncbi:MAG: hypothetical protein ACLUOI_01690 [Eisenbergiella sp.]